MGTAPAIDHGMSGAITMTVFSRSIAIFWRSGRTSSQSWFVSITGRAWLQAMPQVTTAVVTCGIACNQALPVMLTNQLCDEVRPDRQKMAIDLENTVIVIAPLIPWSIAGAVPIASVGAPAACVLAAFYLLSLIHISEPTRP